MQFKEFKTVRDYIVTLENEQKNKYLVDTPHTNEFYQLLPPYLSQYSGAFVRDNLAVDGTFTVIFEKKADWNFIEAINLYETLTTILGASLWSGVKDTGYVEVIDELTVYQGVWFKVL